MTEYSIPDTDTYNEGRFSLHIAKPESYEWSGRSYPILYLLDGYWDFPLVRAIHGNLVYDRMSPEFIIVGIDYLGKPKHQQLRLLRDHDLSHEHCDEFIDDLENVIIPSVEKEYRVQPLRILGGASKGGVVALKVMLSRPGLFYGFVCPSPAVNIEDSWIFNERALNAEVKPRLYMSRAENDTPILWNGIQDFASGMTMYSEVLLDDILGEGHASTKAASYTRGLRFVFLGHE